MNNARSPLFQKKESEIPFEFRGSNFFCQQPGYRMGGIEPEKGPMDARIADLIKLVSELKSLSESFFIQYWTYFSPAWKSAGNSGQWARRHEIKKEG
jgi:hypothetical protein